MFCFLSMYNLTLFLFASENITMYIFQNQVSFTKTVKMPQNVHRYTSWTTNTDKISEIDNSTEFLSAFSIAK